MVENCPDGRRPPQAFGSGPGVVRARMHAASSMPRARRAAEPASTLSSMLARTDVTAGRGAGDADGEFFAAIARPVCLVPAGESPSAFEDEKREPCHSLSPAKTSTEGLPPPLRPAPRLPGASRECAVATMATAYLRRPKNVEIEDRTEALATLEQVLDADCVETWAQFRYRLLPCGVERDSAEATGRGGHRDLETLTLHETGSGGLDEVRSQLPPHEVAYVVYNNLKGSREEDRRTRQERLRVGSCWKKWQALRRKQTLCCGRAHILGWSELVEASARELECVRVCGLMQELSLVVPAESPMHDPVKLIGFICKTESELAKDMKRVLKRAKEDASNGDSMSGDSRFLALQATAQVVAHLEALNAQRMERLAEAERSRKKQIEARRLKQEKIRERNLRQAQRMAKSASRQAKSSQEKDLNVMDGVSVTSKASSHNTEQVSFSDNDGDEWEGEMVASQQHTRNLGATMPPCDELPKSTELSIDSARESHMQQEHLQDLSPIPAQPLAAGAGSVLADLDENDDCDGSHADRQEVEDALFLSTVEEGAKLWAAKIEEAAVKIQGLLRGFRDRQFVRGVKRSMNNLWTESLHKSRHHPIAVLTVWCPSSTPTSMRELPLYHVRDVTDLIIDADTAAWQRHHAPHAGDEMSEHSLQPDVGVTMQGTDHVSSAVHTIQTKAVTQSVQHDPDLSVDTSMFDRKRNLDQQNHLCIPHVVHNARNLYDTLPISVASTIARNFFGGDAESDESDTEGAASVVKFREQALYEELIQKYADVFQGPGVSMSPRRETREERLARLQTKAYTRTKAEYKARLEQQRMQKRGGIANVMQSSRRRSRIMHQESCHNPNQDVCETILAVAKPGLHDLKSRFVYKPWWSLTFPYQGRTERDREHALYAAEDVVLGRNVSQISRASSTESPLTVTEEEWEQRKEKALARIRQISDLSVPLDALIPETANSSTVAEKPRNPALKTVKANSSTFGSMGWKEFKELYRIRCAVMAQKENQGNLQSFLHTIANGCSDACFNLVDMGLEHNCLNFLLKNLKTVMTLTELNLARNPVGDEGATSLSEYLTNNSTLKVLKLESALIGPAGQARIFSVLQSHNYHLETLNLGGSGSYSTPSKNVIGDAGALAGGMAMKVNTQLTCLSLADCRVSGQQLEVFGKGLAKNFILTKLDLSNNALGDGGMRVFATALETLRLTELNLARTEIRDSGAHALAQGLRSWNPPVHTLYLSGNHIAGDGANAFATVLSQNNTVLSSLKLDHNKLGPAGAKALAAKNVFTTSVINDKFDRPCDVLIHYPRGLTDLDLSANDFGDEGAKYVADIIKQNSILTKLDVSCNSIGSSGLKDIGAAMPYNSVLGSLILRNNTFLNQGVTDFVQEAGCINITDLDLSGNRLTEGVGSSLVTLSLSSTSILRLRLEDTFVTVHENELIGNTLKRNMNLQPADPTAEMKRDIAGLRQRAALADKMLKQLNVHKKGLFKLNDEIESTMRQTNDITENTFSEYLRMTRAVKEGKERVAECQDLVNELNFEMRKAQSLHRVDFSQAQRKQDAHTEIYAKLMGQHQQLKIDIDRLQADERHQITHLLDDLDIVLDKKQMKIKKHQKFIKDTLELLKNHDQSTKGGVPLLPPYMAEKTWKMLEKDPTLAQEETLMRQRSKIIKERLELAKNPIAQQELERAARLACVMESQAEAARKEKEEQTLSKFRAMFTTQDAPVEERAKKKLLGKMGGLRKKKNKHSTTPENGSSSTAVPKARGMSQGKTTPQLAKGDLLVSILPVKKSYAELSPTSRHAWHEQRKQQQDLKKNVGMPSLERAGHGKASEGSSPVPVSFSAEAAQIRDMLRSHSPPNVNLPPPTPLSASAPALGVTIRPHTSPDSIASGTNSRGTTQTPTQTSTAGHEQSKQQKPSQDSALSAGASAALPDAGGRPAKPGPAKAEKPLLPRRKGPVSVGIAGIVAMRQLLKSRTSVETFVMRDLIDVQQQYESKLNREKGAWMTQLEAQLEIRRSHATGFNEARRLRRLAELEELRNANAASILARRQPPAEPSNDDVAKAKKPAKKKKV